eukprot:CAMPEP_0203865096 /NCGR_PEP_ID=MMETSP0359-20131031/15159_1 /ASSEMBLY_ACC=CAM_ASM_000338 /TAXON_ID=268821 /ORGANISM="Scrippsiella Hangoei, Strain SHTV-5" /LENGTH=67 /DNA_ID=CAMNT_0050782959 /DNA_START=53 /DNA_END=253 /DNA_ORIENTATION=-
MKKAHSAPTSLNATYEHGKRSPKPVIYAHGSPQACRASSHGIAAPQNECWLVQLYACTRGKHCGANM